MTFSVWFRGLVLAVAGLSCSPGLAAVVARGDCPREPMRLVVLGDSLADGLWGSLFRIYARCEAVETVRLTKVSDGLAKTGADGWLARYDSVVTELDTRRSDVVIVQIGANDITTIRDGRRRESFSTDAWNNMYIERVAGLTSGLRDQTLQVYWLGLPVVGKSRLEEPYQVISNLQKTAVRSAGGNFIDIHDLTTFGTGSYSQNGTYQGRFQQLRHTDKVHFTKSGYDLVAEQILDELARISLNRDRRAALQNVELQ